MLIQTAINFFLDIAKETVTIVLTTQIISFLNKKKNHSADQADGSSSDK